MKMIRNAGAKEVHFLVSSPPVRFPDFYGINTPDQKQLIASYKDLAGIQEEIGVDSLHYLSYKGLVRAIGLPEKNLCMSCFNGNYPVDIGENKEKINYKVAFKDI